MGDFEPISELPVAIVEGINAFDKERRSLYTWLGGKIAEDVSVLSYHEEAERHVYTTAEIFAEASTAIAGIYEDQRSVSSRLIASTWRYDAQDRLKLFMQQLPSDFDLQVAELSQMEQMVNEILGETVDLSDVYNGMGNNYFQATCSDISGFLAAHHEERELRFIEKTRGLICDTPSTHLEVTAEVISLVSLQRETNTLRSIL